MRQEKHQTTVVLIALVIVSVTAGACAKKVPPVARPMPAPASVGTGGGGTGAPPGPPAPVVEPTIVPAMPAPGDIDSRSLDDLNRESPLQPVFFELDSADLSSAGLATLQQNAGLLKKFASWQITIEGHCDERGSAEYNLALGERRALAARDYLVSLGVPATRVRTVSYGKEFPFDPARTEAAFSTNRRAHFVITAK
jgi:peptidoglycan-associated lipoprotein